MAYPTVSAPYGLQPINRVDGLPYAGAIRQIPIDSAYNTPIYNGDIVRIAAGGEIEKSTVTVDSTTAAANNTVGVFVGVQYVNAQGQTVQAQYYPGNAAATSAIAYVVDDPMAAFKVAVTFSGNATVTTVNQSIVGTNIAVRQGSGSNTTGDSGVSVYATNAQGNAAALPLRVIAVVPDTAASATTFREVVVKFNNHQYLVAGEANDYTA
jgi:hypothetical protein